MVFNQLSIRRSRIRVIQIGPLRLVQDYDSKSGGVRKGADSYFPPEDRVRLVRLVSHGELPGERSGGSIIEYSWNNL